MRRVLRGLSRLARAFIPRMRLENALLTPLTYGSMITRINSRMDELCFSLFAYTVIIVMPGEPAEAEEKP